MSFIKQFKIIFWKNWKIFRQRNVLFMLMEVLITDIIICTLASKIKNDNHYDVLPYTSPVPVLPTYGFTNSDIIGIVLPKNPSIDGQEFIHYFKQDKDIVLVDSYKKKYYRDLKIQTFENEQKLEEFSKKDKQGSLIAGIVFGNDYTDYSIRIKGTNVLDSKEEPIDNYGRSRNSEFIETYSLDYDKKYFNSGITKGDIYSFTFVPLQMAVDRTILKYKTGGLVTGVNVSAGKLSKPKIVYHLTEEENKEQSYAEYAPVIAFAFIGQVFHLCSQFMKEKESGTRDGLISIGANRILLWVTWMCVYLPFSILIMGFPVLVDPTETMGTVNRLLFFLISIIYAISIYEIAIIFCLFSQKTKTVTMLFCVFFCALYKINDLIYTLKIDERYEKIEKVISAIFSPIGISMGNSVITFEKNRDGYIGFGNLFESELGKYFIFLVIDVVVYFIIAVAIDYASGINFKTIGIRKSQMNATDDVSFAPDIQEDPVGGELFVQVKNIYKYFKFRRNIVVDSDENDVKLGKVFAANKNISFNVYKNEIFAILGHNGAGKSTLIQNMIGMQRADSGETYYNGLPISKNKKKIHRELGICLQNNVLIDGFSVADHCKLYAGIKEIDVDVDTWLKEVDLMEKKNFEVQKLSGGQKRKVCIGLAMVGNPKYVFLDEPTTGLDPLSRRKIWSLLLKKKQGRVIFITTHYMDEADIIADRKLILNKGSIRCLGSSIYLKNHFQMKYSLEVETICPSLVESIIKDYIPEAIFCDSKTKVNYEDYNISDYYYKSKNNDLPPLNCSGSLCYVWKLPIESASAFSSLLLRLKKEKGTSLTNFSLNAPLLEELFVQLDRESEEKENGHAKLAIELPNSDTVKRPNDFATAIRLASYRMKLYLRRKLYLFMAIILPIIVLSIIFPKFNEQLINQTLDYEERELTPAMYKNQIWNYDTTNSKMDSTIPREIFERELPKLSNNQPNLANYGEKEMERVGQGIYKEPYFVSSIRGNFSQGEYGFTVYYNDSMPHALPSTINAISNAILAANNVNDTIHVSNHPFSFFELTAFSEVKFYSSIVVAICIVVALSFYGSNIVHEKEAKLLKQLQLNGISNKSYWLSVFVSDYFWFLVTCAVIVGCIITFKYSPLYYFNSIVVIALFFALSSIGCILFQYCLSFMFNSENSAFTAFLLINIFPTFFFTYNAYKENLDTNDDEFNAAFYYGSISIDAFLPCYCIVRVIKNLISLGIEHEILDYSLSFGNLLFTVRSQLSCHFIGAFLSIIVYGAFLIYLVKKYYLPNRKEVFEMTEEIQKKYDEEMRGMDEDIYYEYLRVKKDVKGNEMPIKLSNLTKEYDHLKFWTSEELRKAMEKTDNYKYGEYHTSNLGAHRIVMTAFENMNIGINRCECFGILGPNGSGKSSLLNTASFTFKQTLGNIYYDGQNTLDRKENEITLGYCPQEDVLWEEMTLFEHIEMFLYIRGYSKKESKHYAKKFIQYCRLTSHKNKLPSELSGGTRRKLNILIALCCSSSKVMLDEPSAGMDPSTRRYVWDIIKATLQKNKSSTIMTTHSMEEAELLCNRIGIMINGKLRCIGSPEHIKMKYGNTYILDVHTDDINRFHEEVVVGRQLFGMDQYERENKSLQRVKYEVKTTENVSRVFEIMENCRKEGLYNDYSYSQTSLEQVFLNFALTRDEED